MRTYSKYPLPETCGSSRLRLSLPSPAAEVQERPEEDEGYLTLHQPDVRGQPGAEERSQDQQACQRGEEPRVQGEQDLD